MVRTGLLLVCLFVAVTATAMVVEPVTPVKAGGDVAIVEFGPMTVAYTENSGSYANVGKEIGTLMTQLNKQKIEPSGLVMAIYHNNPDMVPEKELRWDVAVQVPEGTEVAEPLKVRVIPASLVAQTAFRGTPDKLSEAYGRLMGAVGQSGHEPVGPAIEIYNGVPSGRIIDCTINFVVAAPGERGPRGIGAELVIAEPMLMVFAEHTGSYAQIGPATEAFLAELAEQGIEPAGPPMHVFLNAPVDIPEEALVWHVAVPIEREREVAKPLMIRGVPERVVARTAFPGPPEAIGEVYRGLAEYALRRGYMPIGPAIATQLPRPERPEPSEVIEEPVKGIHQAEGPPPETIFMLVVEKVPPLETEIVITGPHPQVVMGHEGPFEGLDEATAAFLAELEAQGVHPVGPCTRVLHTEPEGKPFAELCVPIGEEREVAGPLKMRILPECACARAFYEGPVQGVRMAREIMIHQMAERGWRPAGPLMQTIHDRGEAHVACTLMFVVAKMEGGPEPGPEGAEPHEGDGPKVIFGPVKVIKPNQPVIE